MLRKTRLPPSVPTAAHRPFFRPLSDPCVFVSFRTFPKSRLNPLYHYHRSCARGRDFGKLSFEEIHSRDVAEISKAEESLGPCLIEATFDRREGMATGEQGKGDSFTNLMHHRAISPGKFLTVVIVTRVKLGIYLSLLQP